MDEILHKTKKAVRARPPGGDRQTIDLFTGEPFGAPSTPRKLSKRAGELLEYMIARGPAKVAELLAAPPGEIKVGMVAGLLQELRRFGMIEDRLPRGEWSKELLTYPTEAAMLWLRDQRDHAKPEPAPKPEPDPAQQSVLPTDEDPHRWMLGQVRLALKRQQVIEPADVWYFSRRQPKDVLEREAMTKAVREAASRGWCRKLPGATQWMSLIYEPPEAP